MRARLITTVAATVVLVLLALLIPMAVLIQRYALEDRITRAALDVQATETVVSGQSKGAVSVYVARTNEATPGVSTTVYFPDGTVIGPAGPAPERVGQVTVTGQARFEDAAGGAELLLPVNLIPQGTAVVRVMIDRSAYVGDVQRAWALLALLGVVLLAVAVLVADRLSRSFVRPIHELGQTAARLGTSDPGPPIVPTGPPEVRAVASALNRLTDRVRELIGRERENIANLSHRLRTPVTALRLDVDALPEGEVRDRLGADVDELDRLVGDTIREARRSEREGVTAACDGAVVARQRAEFWQVLAEDQQRRFLVHVPDRQLPVRASAADLEAALDALLDNVFSHTPEGTALSLSLDQQVSGGAILTVSDSGPGLPAGDPGRRGTSHAGSTGLGLDIA
ncbi:MAG TPA: HAMP domain-containing sensor histidine kinase, partial [Candidatus Nanopelagicales bacterium]|nr:HAMP domain-containing sensor histidine kinase [Candidatus Nanopelagicales bacterium]